MIGTIPKNPILIVSVVMDDLLRIQSTIGHANINRLLEEVAKQMQTIFASFVFHSRSNVLSLLLHEDMEALASKLTEMEIYLDQMFTIAGYSIFPSFHIDIISTETVKESCDEVYELMNYMNAHHQSIKGQKVYLLNEEIIAQKHRYTTIERILP